MDTFDFTIWENALLHDDPKTGLEWWRGVLKNNSSVNAGIITSEAFGRMLSQTPLPIKVFTALFEQQEHPMNWMVVGANHCVSYQSWLEIFQAYAAVEGQKPIEREMVESLIEISNRSPYSMIIGTKDEFSFYHLCNAILTKKPEIALQIPDMEPCLFFDLASSPSGGTWLIDSGLDIERVFKEGLEYSSHMQLISISKSTQPLIDFIHRHPLFMSTWEKLKQIDDEKIKHLNQWIDVWIGETMTGSPLEAWIETHSSKHSPSDTTDLTIWGSPLDHPAYQNPEIPVNLDDPNITSILDELIKSKDNFLERRSALRASTYWIHNIICGKGNLPINYRCPMDPTIAAFFSAEAWTQSFITQPETAKIIQNALNEDGRALVGLCKYRLNDIFKWCLDSEAWSSWKNKDNMGVAAIYMETYLGADRPLFGEGRNKKKLKVSNVILQRIAKKHPEILLEHYNEKPLFEFIDIRDEKKSSLKKHSFLAWLAKIKQGL